MSGYSDIYNDEMHPPIGASSVPSLGRSGFRNLVAFVSLSKRSHAPGLRSGAVAGDCQPDPPVPALPHVSWCAMALPSSTRVGAWSDEAHVVGIGARYRGSSRL